MTPSGSYAGMAACLSAVSALDLSGSAALLPTPAARGTATAALLMLYVASFALGVGPVTFTYVSEVLPGAVRGKAGSLAACAAWLANLAVAGSFSALLGRMGLGATYLLYACFNAVGLAFVLAAVVETKRRSLRDIEALLMR